MATVPPRSKSLVANVVEFAKKAARRRYELTRPQLGVAVWLRGNDAAMESLKTLLLARCEGRALSPVPSAPIDALIDKARDYEVRSIIAELTALCNSPLPSLNDGDEE